MKQNKGGFGAVEGLLVLVIVGLVGFVGWYVWHAKQNADKNLNSSANTSLTAPSTKKTPAKTVDPYAGWKQYCSQVEGSCFKYPSDWTAAQQDTPNPDNHDGLTLTSPGGTKLTYLSEISGLGGACDPSTDPHVYIHQVSELTTVKGLYVISVGDKTLVKGFGLIKDINGKTPAVGDTGECLLYLTFGSKDGKRKVEFATGVQANFQVFKSGDADTVLKILSSYQY